MGRPALHVWGGLLRRSHHRQHGSPLLQHLPGRDDRARHPAQRRGAAHADAGPWPEGAHAWGLRAPQRLHQQQPPSGEPSGVWHAPQRRAESAHPAGRDPVQNSHRGFRRRRRRRRCWGGWQRALHPGVVPGAAARGAQHGGDRVPRQGQDSLRGRRSAGVRPHERTAV